MSYRNSSWYSDPTAGQAIGHIQREEKRKRRQMNGRKLERPVRSDHPESCGGLQDSTENPVPKPREQSSPEHEAGGGGVLPFRLVWQADGSESKILGFKTKRGGEA